VSALDDLRALVRARELLDSEIGRLAKEATAQGESRSALARVLGVSRATFYRRLASEDELDRE